MRIVSHVPAASAWLRALGVPVIDGPSPIDQPDLLICDGASRARPPAGATITLAFAPRTLKEALDAVLQLARHAQCLPAAMALLAAGEARLARVRQELAIGRDGSVRGADPQRAIILTSLDPLIAGGRWLPDLLAHAGASSPLAPAGDEDRHVEPSDLAPLDAVIVALPLTGAKDAASGAARLAHPRTFAIGSPHACGAGPELYRTVELLAAALYGYRPPAPVGEDEVVPAREVALT